MAELRTLGLSGFDRDGEAEFRALFEATNVPGWALVHENDAAALLIDFDSMYGQMGWLQAQGSGRPIAACTVGLRAGTDFVLRRPLTAENLVALLQDLARATPPKQVSGVARAVKTTPPPPAAPAAAPPQPVAAPAASPNSADATAPEPVRDVAPATVVEAPPAPVPIPVAAVRRRLIDHLDAPTITGPVRLKGAEPVLAFDPNAFTYAGGTALKPFAELCHRDIADSDWQPLTAAEYAALKTELGGTQPLARLRWLAALAGYDGRLCPELADATRFKLTKWPQSEREFPRHFKIATALLKQFATLDELATTSGASREEVADFINACHAIGMIEAEGQPATVAVAEAGRSGLMNRLRGR